MLPHHFSTGNTSFPSGLIFQFDRFFRSKPRFRCDQARKLPVWGPLGGLRCQRLLQKLRNFEKITATLGMFRPWWILQYNGVMEFGVYFFEGRGVSFTLNGGYNLYFTLMIWGLFTVFGVRYIYPQQLRKNLYLISQNRGQAFFQPF